VYSRRRVAVACLGARGTIGDAPPLFCLNTKQFEQKMAHFEPKLPPTVPPAPRTSRLWHSAPPSQNPKYATVMLLGSGDMYERCMTLSLTLYNVTNQSPITWGDSRACHLPLTHALCCDRFLFVFSEKYAALTTKFNVIDSAECPLAVY